MRNSYFNAYRIPTVGSPYNQDLVLKHKAILKFLGLSEAEAATWRVKEAKDVSELSEMTLEEQGDFLTNKVCF